MTTTAEKLRNISLSTQAGSDDSAPKWVPAMCAEQDHQAVATLIAAQVVDEIYPHILRAVVKALEQEIDNELLKPPKLARPKFDYKKIKQERENRRKGNIEIIMPLIPSAKLHADADVGNLHFEDTPESQKEKEEWYQFVLIKKLEAMFLSSIEGGNNQSNRNYFRAAMNMIDLKEASK